MYSAVKNTSLIFYLNRKNSCISSLTIVSNKKVRLSSNVYHFKKFKNKVFLNFNNVSMFCKTIR